MLVATCLGTSMTAAIFTIWQLREVAPTKSFYFLHAAQFSINPDD